MRVVEIFAFVVFVSSLLSLKNGYINPTGTYFLNEKNKNVLGGKSGYFGEIQVKLLSKEKVVMTFYICKGAPSFNSGSIVDTLDYLNNKVVYKDKDCMTEFQFYKNQITVLEMDCPKSCWGHGVVAHGVFKQKSSQLPVLKDPLSDEIIK